MSKKDEKQVDLSLRQFIKELGYIASGTAILSSMLGCNPSQWKKRRKNEKARIGLIGTGSRGQYHIHNLLRIPHAEIVALCDNYPLI